MAYGITLSDPTYVVGTHSGFVVGFIANGIRNDFTGNGAAPGATDGANAILNGGGNLRFYDSTAKNTRYPCEVVRFVTGATPDCEVWVRVPTWSPTSSIRVEADEVETSQPVVTDTYGRNAVWPDYDLVYHFNEDPSGTAPQIIDSTGNGNDLTSEGAMTSGDLVTAQVGLGIESDDSNDRLSNTTLSGANLGSDTFTVTAVVKPSATDAQYYSDHKLASSGAINRRCLLYGFQSGAFNIYNNGYPTGTASHTQMAAAAGSFHHVSYTTNGTTLRGSVDGTELVSRSANLNVATASSELYLMGNSGANRAGAVFDEWREGGVYRSADWQSTESGNLLATAAWGTVGTWADSGGLTAVSKTATLRHDVYNAAQSSATVSWNILNAISRDAVLLWDILTSAGQSATLRWDLLNAIQHDATIRHNVLQALTHDATVLWDVLNSQQVAATVKWDLLNAIQRDATLRWNVESSLTSVNLATTFRWDALNATQSDTTLGWHVLNAVATQSALLWDVLAAAQVDATARWDVLAAITQEITTRWDVLGLSSVAKTATLSWDALESTTGSITLRWSITDGSETPHLVEGAVRIDSITRKITIQSLTRKITIN